MVVNSETKNSRLSTASTAQTDRIKDSLHSLEADRRFCTLCDMMKIQAVVLVFYGLVFFVAPNLFFIPQLGFTDPLPSVWLRALGLVLVLTGGLELSIISKLRKQTSRVWVFMLMPVIFIVCTGIERMFGNYESISLYLWVFEFSMLFLCIVTFISFLRLRTDAVRAETELMHVAADKAKIEALKLKKYAEKKARRAEQAKQERIQQDMRQITKTDPAMHV